MPQLLSSVSPAVLALNKRSSAADVALSVVDSVRDPSYTLDARELSAAPLDAVLLHARASLGLSDGDRKRLGWWCVGEVVRRGRAHAMRSAKVNTPKGLKYCQAFARWLTAHGLRDLDRSDRVRLLHCVDILPRILDWLDTLPPDERRTLNHPSTIWRRFQAAMRVKQPGPKERETVPKVPLAEAWTAASVEEQRDLLDQVGRAVLVSIMSEPLLLEFAAARLGQELKLIGATSAKLPLGLTALLRHALSCESEDERTRALHDMKTRLTANDRDEHAIAIALTKRPSRRKK